MKQRMKQKIKPTSICILIGCTVLAQVSIIFPAQAEIYKCTSKQGKVYYNDKPCPVETKEKKIQNEKDPVNGYVPPAFVAHKSVIKKHENKPVTQTAIPVVKSHEKDNSNTKNSNENKNTNKVKMLSGGKSLNRSEQSNINARKELTNIDKKAPNGNYSERERTLKDKRIYLGIRKDVE